MQLIWKVFIWNYCLLSTASIRHGLTWWIFIGAAVVDTIGYWGGRSNWDIHLAEITYRRWDNCCCSRICNSRIVHSLLGWLCGLNPWGTWLLRLLAATVANTLIVIFSRLWTDTSQSSWSGTSTFWFVKNWGVCLRNNNLALELSEIGLLFGVAHSEFIQNWPWTLSIDGRYLSHYLPVVGVFIELNSLSSNSFNRTNFWRAIVFLFILLQLLPVRRLIIWSNIVNILVVNHSWLF